MKITTHSSSTKQNPSNTFSILIPTWNNLSYVQLCVKSLQKNSTYPHQIILHINEGSDGTVEWAQKQNLDYTHSTENIGVCWAVNSAAHLVKTPYIVYMNDDMYVLPKWDWHLKQEIDALPDDLFFLSSTMIEPTNTFNPAVIFSDLYGQSLSDFNEQKLLEEFQNHTHQDWSGATWPPNVISQRLWHLVGGYSVEFSPGMYSDPDFSMKLWQSGVRYFKGLSQSRVFHFQCKSTGRIKKNEGKKQFKRKWKIRSSQFVKNYLKTGQPWQGPLCPPPSSFWGRPF